MTYRDDRVRLNDIVRAIDKATKYSARGETPFLEDELVQVWALHHLQILGEAANKLSPEIRAAHPEIPWRSIITMRHILVHDYFNVDLAEVWRTLTVDLPPLKQQIESLLREY